MKALVTMGCLSILMLVGCATDRPVGPGVHSGPRTSRTAVAREWRGTVVAARADEYYSYLLEGVKKMGSIAGYLGVEVLRRDEPTGVQFTVISYWETRDAIKAYAGEDIEKPHHLPRDREMLIELPTRVLHYDVTYTDLARVNLPD